MFNNLRDYINNNNLEIHIYKDNIYVLNYKSISSFSDNKIELNDKKICIEGNKLVITKLKKDELLISGLIDFVRFNNGK